MSALMHPTQTQAPVSPSQPKTTTDSRDLALSYLRLHFAGARIKFLYRCRDSYYFRANTYSADKAFIASSDFVVVRVDGPSINHKVQTVGSEN